MSEVPPAILHRSVPESARVAAVEALADAADLDLSAALDRVVAATRKHTRVLPELIESRDGSRRIFWPGDQHPKPSQSLF